MQMPISNTNQVMNTIGGLTERRPRSLSDASTSSENSAAGFTSDKIHSLQNCQEISDLYKQCVANNFNDTKVCSTAMRLYVSCSYSDK